VRSKRIFIVIAAIALLIGSSLAQTTGKVVKAIELEGNKRVSDILIFDRIKTKVGDELSPRLLRDDIKRLYKMGYFDDIKVDAQPFEDGVKLTFIFTEKLIVRSIVIQGNRYFRDLRIRRTMKLSEGDIYDEKVLAEDVQKIKDMYREKGFYQVKVVYEVSIDEKARVVDVNIVIKEGILAPVGRVVVEGNKALRDKEILKVMRSRPSKLSFIFKKYLKEDELQEDLQRIKALYASRGYIKAEVGKPEVELVGKKLKVTIPVEEGKQYRVGQVKVEGNTVISTEEILSLLKLRSGDVYSPTKAEEGRRNIYKLYGKQGRIYTDVKVDEEIDDEAGVVDLTYKIKESAPIYVGIVDVRGNTRTKTKVIRREIRVKPGDLFNMDEVFRSVRNISNLGYFTKVDFDIQPTEEPDVRDLVMRVEEQERTGYFQFGGGYSSIERVVGFAEITQTNFDIGNPPTFVGAGQKLSLRTALGSLRSQIEMHFQDPYFYDTHNIFDLWIFNTTRDYDEYYQEDTGFRFEIEHPMGREEIYRLLYGYRLQDTEIRDVVEYAPLALQEEEGKATVSSATIGLIRDTRDSRINPTEGSRQNLTLEVAGGLLGGDEDFYKVILSTTHFWKIKGNDRLILNWRARAGVVQEYGDTDKVRIFERFFLGGANTIRGYAYRDVGPKDERGDPLGGEAMFLTNLELVFPIAEKLNGAVFVDTGNVWWDASDFDPTDVDTGVGVGVRIATPIGPIKLDYGYAIEEHEARLHFSVGWTF